MWPSLTTEVVPKTIIEIEPDYGLAVFFVGSEDEIADADLIFTNDS